MEQRWSEKGSVEKWFDLIFDLCTKGRKRGISSEGVSWEIGVLAFICARGGELAWSRLKAECCQEV